MSADPNDIKVATEGAYVLFLKAKSDSDEDRDEIIAAGGHIQLVKAITMYPNDAMLCEMVCEALNYITDGSDGPRSAALIAAGAGPVLAAAAQTHSDGAEESAERALNNLGLGRDGTPKVHLLA